MDVEDGSALRAELDNISRFSNQQSLSSANMSEIEPTDDLNNPHRTQVNEQTHQLIEIYFFASGKTVRSFEASSMKGGGLKNGLETNHLQSELRDQRDMGCGTLPSSEKTRV